MNAAQCQYEGVCHDTASNLPFTGFDVPTIVFLAVLFIVLGIVAYKASLAHG